VSLSDVSSILWRERELLEMLLFKLDEEQALLAGGRTRWLARATREVEVVLEELRKAELHRAVEVDAVAAELGLEPAPSLRELAAASDEPWRQILLDHRQAFLTATAEITALAEANRDLLGSGYRSAAEALLSLDGGPDTYTASGTPVAVGGRARLVDGAL
jgi:hypothetical protein